MAENSNNQTLAYLCKYQVPSLIFISGEESLPMDASNILTIEKLDDYEFNIRCILKVSIRVDVRKKLWILKNKRTIVCKFELDKIGMDVDLEEYLINPEIVFNEEFSIFLSDDDESIDIATLEARLAQNSESEVNLTSTEEDYFESQNQMNVYLFQRNLLNASNKTVNKVISKDTLQNMVARLLTETKHEKVLMSPFENTEIYSELLVPAYSAYKGLMYLDQYYGFYKFGALIYYDVDACYILNTNGKITAKRKDEWSETIFMITQFDRSIPGNAMVRRAGEKVFYCNIPEDNLSVQKFSLMKNVQYGSEAKVVITDGTTIDISQADQSYVDQRNTYYKYITKGDNQYTAEIIRARMEENESILYITGLNLDINAFTPNKLYKLVFDETAKQEKYGKYVYRLAYAYHYIYLESGNYMSSSHRIVLKRCANDEASNDQGQTS